MYESLTQLNLINIYFQNSIFTKSDIQLAINHLSKYLQKNIHSTSPFILLSAKNHIKTLIAYFAILKAEKIAVLYDPLSKTIDYEDITCETNPSAVICINEMRMGFNYQREVVFCPSRKDFSIHSDLSGVCTIAYTNAEDGYSKGAMLTEKNLLSEIDLVVKTTAFKNDSVNCALLPYSHLYGFVHGILMSALSGGSALITDFNLLKIGHIADEIYKYKVSHLHTVPSVYYILSKVPGIEYLCHNIVRPYSGGIKLPQFIYEGFYQKTKIKIWEGYGLTECSPAIAGNYDEEGPVLGSLGKIFPQCFIKILKLDGSSCQIGEEGEIYVKGDTVFKGYLNHEETTNKLLNNGWFRTGDMGKMDKNGNIYFCGLKKNMINTAGNKVYPKKLERQISLNKSVMQVQVYSESSVLQGNVISARIKLKISNERKNKEFKNWCLKNINNTTLPKIYVFE